MMYLFSRCLTSALLILVLVFSAESIASDSDASENNAQTDVSSKDEVTFLHNSDLQFRQGDAIGAAFFVKLLVGMIVFAGLLYGVLYYLKKLNIPALSGLQEQGANIKILGIKKLGNKITMFYVDVDGNRLVICQNEGNISISQLEHT